jgi:hypothetical protein
MRGSIWGSGSAPDGPNIWCSTSSTSNGQEEGRAPCGCRTTTSPARTCSQKFGEVVKIVVASHQPIGSNVEITTSPSGVAIWRSGVVGEVVRRRPRRRTVVKRGGCLLDLFMTVVSLILTRYFGEVNGDIPSRNRVSRFFMTVPLVAYLSSGPDTDAPAA